MDDVGVADRTFDIEMEGLKGSLLRLSFSPQIDTIEKLPIMNHVTAPKVQTCVYHTLTIQICMKKEASAASSEILPRQSINTQPASEVQTFEGQVQTTIQQSICHQQKLFFVGGFWPTHPKCTQK